MRILSLVFSVVVTAWLVTAVLTYLGDRIGQNRILVQESWIDSSEPGAYRSYGQVASTEPDSLTETTPDLDTLARR
jgi:hypothetical protein